MQIVRYISFHHCGFSAAELCSRDKAMEETDSRIEPGLGRFKRRTMEQRKRGQVGAKPFTLAKERRRSQAGRAWGTWPGVEEFTN